MPIFGSLKSQHNVQYIHTHIDILPGDTSVGMGPIDDDVAIQ